MFELKPLSGDAIPLALERAGQYRLLNEPWAAESICLDILATDASHQEAVRVLLLARTDQFGDDLSGAVARAREALSRLTDPYEKAYYAGIISERRAKAQLDLRAPGARFIAYEWFRDAMTSYERAEALRPAGNDDAVLRWNTCARLLNDSPHLEARGEEFAQPALGE